MALFSYSHIITPSITSHRSAQARLRSVGRLQPERYRSHTPTPQSVPRARRPSSPHHTLLNDDPAPTPSCTIAGFKPAYVASEDCSLNDTVRILQRRNLCLAPDVPVHRTIPSSMTILPPTPLAPSQGSSPPT